MNITHCVICDCQELSTKIVEHESDFLGERIVVKSECTLCQNCGKATMDLDQMDCFRKKVADKYREEKGLLTSDQLRTYRDKLHMSQKEFAEYLCLSEEDIVDWETYFVQSRSQNNYILWKHEEAV